MMVLVLMLACTGTNSDDNGNDTKSGTATSTSTGNGAKVHLNITSPEDGAVFDYGEAVDFSVETSDGSKIKTAEWTIGDISRKGTDVTIDSLPAGDLHVKVTATVGGSTLNKAVDITVNDPAPLDYHGSVDMQLHVKYQGNDFDDSCPGNLSFTYDGTTLAGSGTCTEELASQEFTFTLDGTSKGGSKISGDLILNSDGTEYSTPFEATGDYGKPINATYDYTHKNGSDSVRVYGTWTASP